jgi:hypothetical protein
LPKFEEKYKDVRVGGFVSAARQYRSRLAREALTKRGIDFDATRRFCKPHTQNHADLSNHSAFLPGSSSVVRNDRNAAATNNSKSL